MTVKNNQRSFELKDDENSNNMLQKVGDSVASFTTRWIPDALAIAVALTILVYFAALLSTDAGPIEIVDAWYGGFWTLLAFAMQMALIVITGYGLATSPPIKKAMRWVASKPNSAKSAIALTAIVMAGLTAIHWGVGLVIGAFLAKEVAWTAKSKGIKVHFPLLAAAGYCGIVVAQSGLSSSAALLVNTPGHFLEEQIGILALSETVFQPYNLVYILGVLLIIPIMLSLLHPAEKDSVEISGSSEEVDNTDTSEEHADTPASKFNQSKIIMLLMVAAGLFYCARYVIDNGVIGINLNVVNFFFLMLGILFHGSLDRYSKAVVSGASAVVGILVQFPFYAGILGIMASTGLLAMIATWFVSISTPETYPLLSMLSAGIVNFAVPSGGGQWAVQGPIAVEAAAQLGLESHIAVMTVMLGDQITNLVQPFWLLPLLGITGLRVGHVLGYTSIMMVVVLAICSASLLIFA